MIGISPMVQKDLGYNPSFIHSITSKKQWKLKEILIITGYDYFLQKRDLKRVLQDYCQIILIPRSTDAYFVGEQVGKLVEKHDNVHLVNNTIYDQQHQVIYEFVANRSKVLRITTVVDFCEKYLEKIYVPESIDDANEVNINLKYFSVPIRLVKKSFDWGVGSLLLLFTSPICVWAYLIIKKQSPGPAFYRQKRVGIRDGEFECTKFRSMRVDAEKDGPQFSSKNDTRIFPFGKTMRATRIDELPQLFNIVKGEMSLIGPRPERRIFTDAFEEQIPHYAQRSVVKPGISGYAQVMYPYGAGLSDARHKLMYDLYYIKNWSLWLEFKVGIMTLWTVVSKGGM